MFPPSMLARLFVRGSLKNTPTGYEFKLKNVIDSGTLTGLGTFTMDNATVDPSKVLLKVGEKEVRGDQLARENPLFVRAYAEILISVEGAPLAAGEHSLALQVSAREAGRLQFNITEPLAE